MTKIGESYVNNRKCERCDKPCNTRFFENRYR